MSACDIWGSCGNDFEGYYLLDLMLCSLVPVYQITCHYIPEDTSFHETII
jgi:hypothetical protein